jgi:large conductance mechanosensitive channel
MADSPRHEAESAMLSEFRQFLSRGNVIDLAIGVVMGAAFGKVVTTIVEGIVMPPIGMVLGRIDFSSLFYVLDASRGVPISLADAKAKAVPVIAYGQLLNDIVGFVIVGLAVFVLIKQVNRLRGEAPVSTRPCPFCLSNVAIGASRCPQCTSELA